MKNDIPNDTQYQPLIDIWKEDSLGCNHKRTIDLGETLYREFISGYKKDTIFIKKIFGNPNKRLVSEEGNTIFIYYVDYVDTCCKDGRIHIEECDYSYISFTMKNNKKHIIFGKGIQ